MSTPVPLDKVNPAPTGACVKCHGLVFWRWRGSGSAWQCVKCKKIPPGQDDAIERHYVQPEPPKP